MPHNASVAFKWNNPVNRIIAEKVLRSNRTLLFMASSWHRLFTKFVPRDTGLLALDGVDIYVEGGKGVIHHKAPYAARVYYGTHLRFRTDKHPLASALWDRAAVGAGLKDVLIRDVQAFINRGG